MNKTLLKHFAEEILKLKQLNLEDNIFIGGTYGLKLHGLNTGKAINEIDLILVNPTKLQTDYIDTLISTKTEEIIKPSEVLDDAKSIIDRIIENEDLQSVKNDSEPTEDSKNINVKSHYNKKLTKGNFHLDMIAVITNNTKINDIITEDDYVLIDLYKNHINVLNVNYIIKEKLRYTFKSKKGLQYSRTKDLIDICNLKNLNFNF